MRYNEEELPSDTGLLCPITGSRLMYTGHEEHVMDGLSFYAAESDPKAVKYSRHPFQYDMFYAGNPYKFQDNEYTTQRVFRLNDDRSWTEMIKAPISGCYFPIDAPNEIIAKHVQEYEEKERIRTAEYVRKVASGEIVPGPELKRVVAQTIGLQLVEVKPISAPIGVLNFMDFKYKNNDE